LFAHVRCAEGSRGRRAAYVSVIPQVVVRDYDDFTSIAHADVVPGGHCAAAIKRAFTSDCVK